MGIKTAMKKIIILLFPVLLLIGCVNHYRFESRGTVELASGQTADAVMYWFGDEGRLWYGKSFRQIDSDLELRVCGVTPKSFVPHDQSNALQLPGRSGDMQILNLEQGGQLSMLAEPIMVRESEKDPCGKILVAGNEVEISQLNEGIKPDVVFLCKNIQRPDRYPNARLYSFQLVSKTEIKNRKAPVACKE